MRSSKVLIYGQKFLISQSVALLRRVTDLMENLDDVLFTPGEQSGLKELLKPIFGSHQQNQKLKSKIQNPRCV